jgi:UDP-N-acetyl-2-amino-2-deoxyglucuronate dehydrogenase
MLPDDIKAKGQRTFRSIKLENQEIEFSDGFTDLHTDSYKHILSGNGFGLQDARNSINMVFDIRNASPTGINGEFHPLLKKSF